MKLMKHSMVLILAAALIFGGCKSDDPYEKERVAIESYKKAHNITAEPLASGLYYIETKAGTGAKAVYGSKVQVKYKGTFTDGTEFDSGTYDFLLGISSVIDGWTEGIGYMKEGGKAILIVPSDLGYGSDGNKEIPGYTPLIFDVELINIY
ncbi:MAG: FKBP-type peptidyl-prolyl cis-trans isomerase [Bacteroidia bacterium]|nr:FKBP-type peptidyl-prolyl cis-trans isomerase [Bacteroidia bacterium]